MSVQTALNILLLGLEESLEAELSMALGPATHRILSARLDGPGDPLAMVASSRVDMVFCPANPGDFRRVIQAVSNERAGIPVVAVSRHPEMRNWLDAIEAGASDYCGAPFEPRQMQWLLDSNVRRAA